MTLNPTPQSIPNGMCTKISAVSKVLSGSKLTLKLAILLYYFPI